MMPCDMLGSGEEQIIIASRQCYEKLGDMIPPVSRILFDV